MLYAVVRIDSDFEADHCISARSGLCGAALRLSKGGAELATTCCIIELMLKRIVGTEMREKSRLRQPRGPCSGPCMRPVSLAAIGR